jgi:hypothetical protein
MLVGGVGLVAAVVATSWCLQTRQRSWSIDDILRTRCRRTRAPWCERSRWWHCPSWCLRTNRERRTWRLPTRFGDRGKVRIVLGRWCPPTLRVGWRRPWSPSPDRPRPRAYSSTRSRQWFHGVCLWRWSITVCATGPCTKAWSIASLCRLGHSSHATTRRRSCWPFSSHYRCRRLNKR